MGVASQLTGAGLHIARADEALRSLLGGESLFAMGQAGGR